MPKGLYRRVHHYLRTKQLEVIETTPEDHDRQIAVSLSLTHFIGRSLSAFGAGALKIDTEGYRRLMYTLGVVEHDTWQLFEDMHRFNPFARQTRAAFMEAMQKIDQQLDHD
jgi:prephenate dehydrogenase